MLLTEDRRYSVKALMHNNGFFLHKTSASNILIVPLHFWKLHFIGFGTDKQEFSFFINEVQFTID